MNNRQLKDIIEEIVEKDVTTISEIATKAAVDRTYLSKLLNNDKEIQLTDNLLRKFKKKFPAYFPAGPKPNNKNNNIVSGETPDVDSENQGEVNPVYLKTLIESNKMQAESLRIVAETAKINAESTRIIARSHEELVKITKVTAGIATADVDGNTLLSTVDTLNAIREFVVEHVVKVSGLTPDEVNADLNRKVKRERRLHKDTVAEDGNANKG